MKRKRPSPRQRRAASGCAASAAPQQARTAGHADFTPVARRPRHDGWTEVRQITFVQALADTGCVSEAADRVGMSVASAYRLRRQPGAESFRQAWDMALDFAIDRIAHAAIGRAIAGVVTPVFYKGEQIGERRQFDERLTMFLLRYRRQQHYGAWLDKTAVLRAPPEGPAARLQEGLRRIAEDAAADEAGRARPVRPPLVAARVDQLEAIAQAEADRRREADREREQEEQEQREERFYQALAREAEAMERHAPPPPPFSGPDVA